MPSEDEREESVVGHLARTSSELLDENHRLRAAVDAVRELHQRSVPTTYWCRCGKAYRDCPTATALDAALGGA